MPIVPIAGVEVKLEDSRRTLVRVVAAGTAALLLAGCASSGAVLSAPRSRYGSPTPEQAVRTFLDAASSKDYERMGEQFGTRNGPAELDFGAKDIQQRMVVLAAFLVHSDYSVEAASQSLLKPYERRFAVHLKGTSRGAVTIPFITVTTKDNRWYVERINLDPLTRQGGL